MLVHLNVTGCCISDIGIRGATTTMDQLRVLILSGLVQLTDAALRFVPKNCPMLEVLDVSGCVQLTDVSFFVILENYWIANGFEIFQKFSCSGCVLMGVNEYQLAEKLEGMRAKFKGCTIVCTSFGKERAGMCLFLCCIHSISFFSHHLSLSINMFSCIIYFNLTFISPYLLSFCIVSLFQSIHSMDIFF